MEGRLPVFGDQKFQDIENDCDDGMTEYERMMARSTKPNLCSQFIGLLKYHILVQLKNRSFSLIWMSDFWFMKVIENKLKDQAI